AALALRTRHALTTALGRACAGQLDFGPGGNTLFLGVRYRGDDGETVSLRNLGTHDTPLDFQVAGADAVAVIDAWGNAQPAAVKGGRVQLTLGQLPIYVKLPRGARLVAPSLSFGPALAAKA